MAKWFKWFKKAIFHYLLVIFAAGFSALLIRFYVVEAYRIPTEVMAPSLISGDYIFLNKLAYVPNRGDVVIFSFSQDPTKSYIKRVVAVEGDEIEIKSGEVLVNGKSLGLSKKSAKNSQTVVFKEKSGNHVYDVQWDDAKEMVTQKMAPIKIPSQNVFVLGDHRSRGQDSRTWSFIPVSYLKGRVSVIWFSLGKSADGKKTDIRWPRIFKRVD